MSKSLLIKNIGIGVAAVISATVWIFLLKNFLVLGTFASLIWLVSGTILFLAVFLIQTLLIDKVLINVGIIAADILLIIVFSPSPISVLLLAAGVVTFGFFLSAHYSGQLELKNNLDIRFFKTGRIVLGLASTGIAALAISIYFALLNVNDPVAAKKSLAVLIRPIEPIVAAYVPSFTIQDSLTQVAAKILPAEFKLATDSVKSQLINESAGRLADIIESFAKVPIGPSEKIIDIFYKSTIGRFVKMDLFLQSLVIIAAGLVLLLSIKLVLTLINWLTLLIAFFIYQLLWGSGFFKVEVQTRTKKVLVLEGSENDAELKVI